ncbi:SDR family oxidoreductase [Rubrivirga sp. S365]|uniref:dTDP-4-dehydrorhamnose reductase n=1 Tax=Rubrivirga litoralis TaxID=3075598 RepID=A0ABU3BQQ4_9BACT|nr:MULTISPECIES: SDR family oxidoreductase [unclassified Rubrivirga]MDT0631599.1 SDR family oxidoreductase [Rubrivirga sp. F394]MDT7857244.1 SDR family oxidoreductase [Rubrivirga sp. S365]
MLPPRILVTGANGLVGQALARAAGRWRGADVLATGRRPALALGGFAGGTAALDVTDADAVERALQDFAPDVVLHAAGLAQVEACEADREACWALNVEATTALAAACHRHGARLVLPSTDFVFDGERGPYAEDARPAPLTHYGRTKLAAENALKASRLTRWAVARTTLVFGAPTGPAPRLDFVRWLVRELGAGRPVRVPSDQVRTPTYDEDFADGVLRIVRFGKSGTFHVAGREVLTTYALALRVAEAFGLDAGLVSPTTTTALHPGAPRPLKAGLLILRAETELGYRPRPLDAALADLRGRLGVPRPSARR